MAESGLVKDLHDNFLQCAICMEGYKSPRMLPCFHSFCLKCLEKLAQSLQNKPFSCPTCRAAVTIPKTGLKDLPSNFLLVSLMERLHLPDTTGSTSSSKCHFCHGIKNLQFCIDCNIHVCVTCKQFHDKIPDFHDHTVIPIEKFSDEIYMKGILALEVPRCSEHQKEKLRFYCTTCCKFVCRYCTIVANRGHECLEATTGVNIVKQNVQRAIENSEKSVISVRHIRANFIAAKTSIERQISYSERKIDQQYDQVIEMLNADRNILKEELEEIRKENCTSLKEINDEVKIWTEAIENTQAVAKKIMIAENQWDILGMEKDITDAFKKLHDDDITLSNRVQEVSSNTITFSPSVISVSTSASQTAIPVNNNLPGNVYQPPHPSPHFYHSGNYYRGVNILGPGIPPSAMSVSTSASQMSTPVRRNLPGNVNLPPHQTPHSYNTGHYYRGVNILGPGIPSSAMSVSNSASQTATPVRRNPPGNVNQPPHPTPHSYNTGTDYGDVNSLGPGIPPSAMSVSTSASQMSTPVNENLLGTVKQSFHKTRHVAHVTIYRELKPYSNLCELNYQPMPDSEEESSDEHEPQEPYDDK